MGWVTLIHRAAWKSSSRKPGFRQIPFSEIKPPEMPILANAHSPCPIAALTCPTVTSVCFIVAGLYSLFDPTKARRGCGERLSDGRNRGSLCPQSSRGRDTRLNASPSLASHIVPECITCARLWSAPGHSSRSSSSTVVLTTSSEPSTSSVKARCCRAALTPMRRSQFMLIHTERPLAALLLCQPPHLL